MTVTEYTFHSDAGVAYKADEVGNADDIALGPVAVRELGGVTGFRITALRTGTVDIAVMVADWAGVLAT